MREIQIYEVENTNLLYVVTDRNQDASYYSKSNLRVEAVDNYVVMWNNEVQFFKELPIDFIIPTESSVVDLVEIIQGYISNVLPVSNEELDSLKEIIDGQNVTNGILTVMTYQLRLLKSISSKLDINNYFLKKIYK